MKRSSSSPPTALAALILAQPILDAASFWLNRCGISNLPTLAVRFAILAATVFFCFRLSRRKGYYYGLGAIFLVLLCGHIFACIQAGYRDPVSDLVNQVRILVLPLNTLCFMTLLDREPRCYEAMKKGFLGVFGLILLILVLSSLTGTEPHTYASKGIGLCGWFYDTSSQSAILSMVIPVALAVFLEKRPGLLPAIAASIVCFGVLWLFATRLAYFSLVFTGLVLGIAHLTRKHTRSRGAAILAAALLFTLLYPLSPMVKNQTAQSANYDARQDWIDAQVESADASTLEERLAPIYDEYLPGLVEQFGYERTMKAYDYRTDSKIAEARPAKLQYSRMLLEDSPASARFFGMELSRWNTSAGNYDVENDLHGIFFLCGAVGLGAFLLFFLGFALRTLLLMIRWPQNFFRPEVLSWAVSALLGGAHIYATAGVLRRPNAAFYLAICLTALCFAARDPKAEKH